MEKIEFEKKYNSLERIDQEILQIIALIYEPKTITELKKCIEKLGIFTNIKHNKRSKIIRGLQNHFIDVSENRLFIKRGIIDFIVKDYCLKNPNFNFYKSKIFEIYPVEEKKTIYWSAGYEYYKERIIRDFRISFFLDDKKGLEHVFTLNDNARNGKYKHYELYLKLFNNSFSDELMHKIPDEYKFDILKDFYYSNNDSMRVISYIEENAKKITDASIQKKMFELLASYYFSIGKLEKLKKLIRNKDIASTFYAPSIEFLQGNTTKAKELYISEIQKVLGRSKRKYCPPGIYGVYFALTMLATNDMENHLFQSAIDKGVKEKVEIYQLIKAYLASKTGEDNYSHRDFHYVMFSVYEEPIACLLLWIIDKDLLNKKKLMDLAKAKEYAEKINCEYLMYQCDTVLNLIDDTYKISPHEKEKIRKFIKKYFDLSTLFKEEEEWKKSLKILNNIVREIGGKPAIREQSERVVWFVEPDSSGLEFYPREQVMGKDGKWSKGRPIALKRIMLNQVDCMSSIDKQIATCISEERYSTYGHYYETVYELNTDMAMPHFLKHPYLFLKDSPATPIELIKEEIQLIVKRKSRNFEISFSHDFNAKGIQVVKETPTRFKIIEVADIQMRIAQALGKKHKLVIPNDSESELKNIISRLSAMITIHSDIKGGGDTKIVDVKAVSKPHIHLLPVGEGIRSEFFVRPFGKKGQYCKPGQGGKTVISEINGEYKQANRNLKKEKESVEKIIAHCPSLAVRGNYNDIFNFETPEECLEALLELQEVKDDIVIEWPEGEKLRVRKKYSLADMNIAVIKMDDWFEIDASLQIDENLILSMGQLLEGVSHSRFIELNNGEFIALTNDLKHKIERLKAYTYTSNGKLKIHPLNVLPVDELFEDCNARFDKHWKKQLKKAEDSLSFNPVLPSTFHAELRPYQLDGYKWLSRLANWEVGACLADDMGLGKTVQALAVILERAIEGPTLVVAPASVCINWINESNKFAPTLNTMLLGFEDRKEILNTLKPFDVIVCSYGLLLSELKHISEIQWTTTVLDEAQAIKNFKAKRTKAALNLKSKFKLITTGTPIENHLSEFWTLFSFINPGLLGSLQDFSLKFAVPIERDHDNKIRNSLKKIIQPFLLRRTKTQVLDELPAKTEINLLIEMSSEESAFYESLRRNSVTRIESMREKKGGMVNLQIFAELTKLRRACCHPALIIKETTIESSKLSMFVEIVNELIENNHKALVFSQFTGHLAIIRKTCDKIGITYQYLDGSTTIKERQKRVNSFQAGEGDIFLISLKAGGVGLNLTAADYVIHMDPWWNPAVEDQASDRAHRIGQQHPVTVYRLLTKGTVEEKIISLHKSKRELVDSLLEGADVSGKLSTNELFALIK